MKIQTSDGRVYHLHIQHHRHEDESSPHSVITTAHITNYERDEVGRGRAMCMREDRFRKKVGTKLALKRALRDAGFERKDRTIFWKAIWNQK